MLCTQLTQVKFPTPLSSAMSNPCAESRVGPEHSLLWLKNHKGNSKVEAETWQWNQLKEEIYCIYRGSSSCPFILGKLTKKHDVPTCSMMEFWWGAHPENNSKPVLCSCEAICLAGTDSFLSDLQHSWRQGLAQDWDKGGAERNQVLENNKILSDSHKGQHRPMDSSLSEEVARPT